MGKTNPLQEERSHAPSSDTLWYSSSHTLALVGITEAGHRADCLDDPRVLDTKSSGKVLEFTARMVMLLLLNQ